MTEFVSRSIRLAGSITLRGPVGKVFPLFSPLGEKRWVPEWSPQLLHPPGAVWEEGMIFRTREETGDAIWTVTRLDPGRHEVRYERVEPERYVARIEVRCSETAAGTTEASTVYEFVGLSRKGNDEIAAMSQEGYAEKMARWERWINDCLEAGAG
jgi:hypothetical protein